VTESCPASDWHGFSLGLCDSLQHKESLSNLLVTTAITPESRTEGQQVIM
jgi:hypothetical protein